MHDVGVTNPRVLCKSSRRADVFLSLLHISRSTGNGAREDLENTMQHQAASATPSTAIQLSVSTGRIIIGIDELSEIIHRASATIRTQATRETHKLPPRFRDGSNSVLWRLCDVWAWQDQLAGQPAATPQSDKPVKRRGAPTAAEKLAAKNSGFASVAEYRSAQAQAGVQ